MDKAGIEKRIYRPGYYFSPLSSKTQHHQLSNDITGDKINVDKSLPEQVSIDRIQHPDTSDLAILNTPIQSNSIKKALVSFANTSKENLKNITISNIIPLKVTNSFVHRSSLMELRSRKSLTWDGDGCADGCIRVVGTIVIACIALAICAVFPAIAPEGAYLIADGVALLLMLIALLLSRDMRGYRGHDMHHGHH